MQKRFWFPVFTGVIIVLFFSCAKVFASHKNAGTSVFPYLNLEMEARKTAMGISLNPAEIAIEENKSFSFSRIGDVENINYNYIEYTEKGKQFSILSTGINLDDQRDENGNIAGNIDATQFVLSGAYATEISHFLFQKFPQLRKKFKGLEIEKIFAGVEGKFINDKIVDDKKTALAFDVELLVPRGNYTFGMSLRNLGPDVRGDPLPLVFGSEVIYKDKENNYLVIFGLEMPRDNYWKMTFGGEYKLTPRFCLRGAYRFQKDSSFGLSLGFGVKYQNWKFDYAWRPSDELGDTQRVTIGYKIE